MTGTKAAVVAINGTRIAVVLVDSTNMVPAAGDSIIARLQHHFPTLPIMLVSIENNGFRAHAAFQTGELLALLQLKQIPFEDIDLDVPPVRNSELPF